MRKILKMETIKHLSFYIKNKSDLKRAFKLNGHIQHLSSSIDHLRMPEMMPCVMYWVDTRYDEDVYMNWTYSYLYPEDPNNPQEPPKEVEPQKVDIVLPDTVLWFGKYKSKCACEAGYSYLLWADNEVEGFNLDPAFRNELTEERECNEQSDAEYAEEFMDRPW